MDIKIPELPEASTSYDSDLLVVEQNTGTKKVTKDNFFGDQIKFDELGLYEGATPINADQLEGHTASYFQQLLTAGSGIDITGNVISNQFATLTNPDLNTLFDNFMGYVNGCSNKPAAANSSGHLIVIARKGSNKYTKQIYSAYNSDDIYVRTNNNDTWTAWRKLSDCYIAGDTLSRVRTSKGWMVVAGQLVTATSIIFSIPLSKPINASSITFTKFVIGAARGISGTNVIANVDVATATGYSLTVTVDDVLNALNCSLTIPSTSATPVTAINIAIGDITGTFA